MGQIDQFERAFEALVAAFGAAFFLIDPQRTVLARNAAARELDRQEGVLQVDGQGILVSRVARDDQSLAESVERVLALAQDDPHRPHALSLTLGCDDTARGTMIHVLALVDVPGMVVVKVPRVVAPDSVLLPEVLRLAYGLTRAEGRLAAAMLAGQTSGADLAQTLGRSEWTVRTQIRSLLAKLGVTTKTEAIARMSAEVLPMDFGAFIGGAEAPRQKDEGALAAASRARASRAP